MLFYAYFQHSYVLNIITKLAAVHYILQDIFSYIFREYEYI